MSLEELQAKRARLKKNSDITLNNMQKLVDESLRVADVAHHSKEILDDLDKEFETKTGLQGDDVKFLFAAVALQIIRIALLNNITKIEKAGAGNRNETKLHKFQENLLGKFQTDEIVKERPYYASMEHIITKPGVPYDATAALTQKSVEKMIDKGRNWDFNLTEMLPDGKLSLFKGANHRFATLGHDPILGLIFGTANIMTDTIICVKTPILGEKIGIPVLTTNHVIFSSDYKDPRIATYGSTAVMIEQMIKRTMNEPRVLVAALIKQIIHIGTDLYTPCGIQVPSANLILSNAQVEKITGHVSSGDIIKIGASAKIADLINMLISTLHNLKYDTSMDISRELYNVRTRKIVQYSNMIATGSNVLWVGTNMMLGNEGAVQNLDIGGLLVMIKRLMNDKKYIRQIKEEFVFGEFQRQIQGKNLGLEETVWD